MGAFGRHGYHNWQWPSKMKEVGLYPNHIGGPGAKATGDRVRHFIIAEAPFARAYAKLARYRPSVELAIRNPRPVAAQAKRMPPARCAGRTRGAKADALFIWGICYRDEDLIRPMQVHEAKESVE